MGYRRTPALLRLFACAALAAGSLAGHAAPAPALDRVSLWLGGYYTHTDLGIAAESRDLGLSTGDVDLNSGHEIVGRARLDLLLGDHHGLTFDYYSLSHSSTRNLSQPFQYEGLPFELDTALTGRFRLRAGSAVWHRWFGESSDVFGVGIGATWYQASLRLSGTVAVDGVGSTAGQAQWRESALAPVLTVGYKHAFSPDLRAYVTASGVWKNGGRLSGHLYDARIGAEWFPWAHFGIGAEYGVTHIHLDRTTAHFGANLDIDLDGPSLFARMRF